MLQDGTLDLENYEQQKKLFHNEITSFYEVNDQIKDQKNIAKIWRKELKSFNREQIIDLYREIYINSQIKHPCFLKYIGFSLINFQAKKKPLILFENINPKGSLQIILNSKSSYDMVTFYTY